MFYSILDKIMQPFSPMTQMKSCSIIKYTGILFNLKYLYHIIIFYLQVDFITYEL